ncbi:hypothetical protein SELMODRAFT_415783 [Selaginella moellendorffii]|uniref:Helicase C-terminal domain-containing protein n=1 Tax=Selaginella moellendorffii TaxID=88036 RepID=D8RX82_SELML|nr:ATP-dependent RNA helicase WM6 [Selaginella moellendorffii]EFJ23213.1 hypothetical protein SELMODRAFT_415783 [Selaginella moellendorffii]|eukprot:XP_002975584.1 ATP-dependent RNA helicase WM6 [Selaginella moellendorffii]
MPPDERADAIDQFVSYDVNILVTTGAWPQDLPVESAEVVYMYDFPESSDSYVKQIGECDKPGVRQALVITFVRDFQDSWRERLEAECCTRIEPLPEHITGLYRRCFPIVVTPAAWNSIQKLAKKHGLL